MAVDFCWMSSGGVLLGGDGDLACTSEATLDSVRDVARSRLKAALNGWKQYAIGADLQAEAGNAINPELDLSLKRRTIQSLSNDFLPSSSFQVQVLSSGTTVQVLVFLDQQLLAQASVSTTTGGVTVQ